MAIGLNQHRFAFKQAVVATYTDEKEPVDGLSRFFPEVTTDSLAVSIEVERNGEFMATDVMRCTDPNRNIFSKSTEKIFIPPFFNESTDVTACEVYDVTFGMGVAPTGSQRTRILQSASRRVRKMKNKIVRAIIKQRTEVLQTGIVTLINGDNIDFKRKAASLPVLAGANTWDNLDTANPFADMMSAANFIRRVGKSGAVEFNVIMGASAMANFFANEKVLALADIRRFDLVDVRFPQFDNTTGIVIHGRFGAGNYIFNIMAYDEYYDVKNPDGSITSVDYIDANNVIVIPNDFRGVTSYGALPMVMGDPVSGEFVAPVEGAFQVHDVIDQIKTAWDIIIRSAPLVIPVSVDRVVTIKTA